MAKTQTEEKKELTPIAPSVGGEIRPFIPKSPEEIKWTVGMILGAGLAPDSFNNDQKKIAVGIMKGLEVGMAPLTALQWIAIINGRPTIWGDGAIALVQAKGALANMKESEIGERPADNEEVAGFADDYGFRVEMWRRGQDAPFIGEFTVGDARRAKLWMSPKRPPWMQYPKRMLRMRAAGFAIRNGFADCLAGMMIREEVEDIPAAPKETDTSFLDDDGGPVIDADEIPDIEPIEETEAA